MLLFITVTILTTLTTVTTVTTVTSVISVTNIISITVTNALFVRLLDKNSEEYDAQSCPRVYSEHIPVSLRVREVILKKKLLPFGHCPKGGGVQPKSKSFEVVFFWAFFWTFSIEGGGVEPIPKVLR